MIILFNIASSWFCLFALIIFVIASIMAIDLRRHYTRHKSETTYIFLGGWEMLDCIAMVATLITGIAVFPCWQSLVSLGLLTLLFPLFFLMYRMASIKC